MPEGEPTDSTDDLQFTTAEPVTTARISGRLSTVVGAQTCIGCGRPIVGEYYAVGDKVVCPSCCAQLNVPPNGSKVGRLFKATVFGLAAGLLGALIWFVIRRAAHLEIGIIAVLVGFMVGKAVRKGSGGRGGRGYQVLAVVLTYCCISANYMPDVIEGFIEVAHKHESSAGAADEDDAPATQPAIAGKGQPDNASPSNSGGASNTASHHHVTVGRAFLALVVVIAATFAISLAAPFLAGAQNIIGLLIIGFALWEAWKFNRYRPLPISGPFRIGSTRGPGMVA